MKTVLLSDTELEISLSVSALIRLDALRPGIGLRRLSELTRTTTGLLDLAQAMTGTDRERLAALLLKNLQAVPAFREELLDEAAASMRMEAAQEETGEVDVVLEQLRAEKDAGLTCRRLISMGLSAGLSLADMGPLPPGMVVDLYMYRLRYDDEQHGIRRKKQKIYD